MNRAHATLVPLSRAGLAALVALSCACGEREPPPLEACPSGDAAWVAAGRAAKTGDEREALAERARALQRTCDGAWAPHWLEADTVAKLGRVDDALAAYERAYGIATERDEEVGVSLVANPLASLLRRRGEAPRAESLYAEAIDAARRAGRRDLEAYARANGAGLLVEQGRFARAIEELERAEAALAEAGESGQAVRLAYNRATLHLRLGDVERARTGLERTHEQALASGDTLLADHAAVALGALHLVQERPESAKAWYGRVGDASPAVRRRARFGLGRVQSSLGDPDGAIATLREVATLARESDPGLAVLADCFIAEAESHAGRTDAARARLIEAIDVSDRIEAGKARWIARWLLGRVELGSGRREAALPHLRAAVALIERQGDELDRSDEGLRYLRERFEPYVDLARALMGGSSAGTADEAPPGEGRVRPAAVVPASDELLRVVTRAHARALRQVTSVRTPHAAEAARIAEIRRGLAPRAWLLVYLLGNERGVLIAISRKDALAIEIAGRDVLLGPLGTYRAALLAPSARGVTLGDSALAAGRALTRALVAPLGERLADASRLWIVPDRELALLPFSALPYGEHASSFLGDERDVALLSAPGVPPGPARARPPVLLAGLPEPVAGADPDLVWSAHEIERVAALWGDDRVTLVTGRELTEERLLDETADVTSGRFRTLHFASHARASLRDPSRSGVLLSGGAMLGLADVATMRLDDALVVLSACRTGEGEIVPGEGIVGLRWAFLGAGARAVVSSLWSVDDAATSDLMIAFHERLRKGEPVVDALEGARREARAKHGHPRYWAPFVLVESPAPGSGADRASRRHDAPIRTGGAGG